MEARKSTLYDITGNYLQLLDIMEEENDVDTYFDSWEGLDGEFEIKAEGYAKVMAEMNARANAIKVEEERLYARRKAIENNVANMKQALQGAMEVTGKTKFKTDLFSFNVQNNPASVFIPDESRVPKQFLVPQPPKVDKKSIAQFLKDGNECDFAELTVSQSLRIR